MLKSESQCYDLNEITVKIIIERYNVHAYENKLESRQSWAPLHVII